MLKLVALKILNGGTPNLPSMPTPHMAFHESGIHRPSGQYMRIVCEALHTDKANTANSMSLYHEICAKDLPFTTLLCDSLESRLVYKVMCNYDTETCNIDNAGGYWSKMKKMLEDVLPTFLHVNDNDSDNDSRDL
jgi:hypothetical protein